MLDMEQRLLLRQDSENEERRRALTEASVELGQLRRFARRWLDTYALASDAARREFAGVAHEAEVVLGI